MNELFEKGLKKRRATLGTDYVDNTMAMQTSSTALFKKL